MDYLIPTYQKNAFDTTDIAWRLTVEAVRGAGPILPKKRRVLGYDEDNASPLGLLVNAYRRMDPGTKNLALPTAVSREFKRRFFKGEPDYIQDEKWYKAAQEADREKGAPKAPADPGEKPSDEIDDYLPTSDGSGQSSEVVPEPSITEEPPKPLGTTSRDELITNSEIVESHCGKYTYATSKPPFEVSFRRMAKGSQIKASGVRLPCVLIQDGVDIDYFFDENHPTLNEYPLSPKQLLLHFLAEKFSVRDHGTSFNEAFLGLVENHLTDERINAEALKERARAILSNIQDKLPHLLAPRINSVKSLVEEMNDEFIRLCENLLDESPELLTSFQNLSENAHEALAYLPSETIVRLINQMPEEFFDGKVFSQPYLAIKFPDEVTTERLRRVSVDKVVNLLRDIRTLFNEQNSSHSKHELIRYSNTLSILEDRLA